MEIRSPTSALLCAAAIGLAGCAAAPMKPGSFTCPPGTRRMDLRTGLKSWCLDEQGRHTGPFRALHANGGLASQGEMRAGRMHGTWTGWHPNGQRSYVHGYRDGQPHGRWTDWTEDGRVYMDKTFVAGRVQGPFERWHRETGVKAVEGRYLDGQADGPWTSWYPAGTRASQGTFSKGRPVGAWRYWHRNGKPAAEGSYRDGDKVGEWRFYASDGELALVWKPPAARRADGQPCDLAEDCQGGACEGPCPPGQGRCTRRERACTDDVVQHMACDGSLFAGSSTCPFERTAPDMQPPDPAYTWSLSRLRDPH